MNKMQRSEYENLKIFAGKKCLSIFDSMSIAEMENAPIFIREAWHVGSAISDIFKPSTLQVNK